MWRKAAAAFVVLTTAQAREEAVAMGNPIRRVVSMLQMMQQKVTEEGKKEKELYEKFMCYCKTGSGDLSASIAEAESKVTQDTSALQEAEALKAQLEGELAQHKADRADAKDAVAKAKAMRAKEAAAFSKEDSDYKTNIAALGKAIDAIDKGMAGSFLQSSAGSTLRRLAVDMDLSSADRDILSSFLAEGQGYAPQSGEISGILKQMKETMEKDHSDITATENEAIANFEALVAAKEKEIAANSKAIEEKTERDGQVAVNIVDLKEDLDDTTQALLADRKFLDNLDKDCATKTSEWEERSKVRAEELIALGETIKLLNDDDALELFKKSLPSPSLLQTQVNSKAVRHAALAALRAARGHDPRLDTVLLALTGRAHNFDKVLKMIDNMVSLLGTEQTDDDSKKEYCESQFDKNEDAKKELDHAYDDLQTALAEAQDHIGALTEEIKELVAGIKALDKSVAEATENRQRENAEYKDTMAADGAAKDLIHVAKNRLAKFYAPALYKPPPKRELSAEDRIFVNNGGTPPPTDAPGGIANTGITYLQETPAALVQVRSHRGAETAAPPPPPETWGAYQTKGQEHNGVVAMLDMLVADLDKEMQERTVEETEAQKEYEQMMQDSAEKRAADSKAIAGKEGAKADLEGNVQRMHEEAKATAAEAMAKAEILRDLHAECDWLLQNFDARKEARAGEVDSLKKARAILSGADYALVQTRARQLRGR